jgi:hypothetical protein
MYDNRRMWPVKILQVGITKNKPLDECCHLCCRPLLMKTNIGPTFRQAPHNRLVGQLPLNDISPINHSIIHALLNWEGGIMGPTEEISEHRKGVFDNNNNTMRFLYSEFDKEWPLLGNSLRFQLTSASQDCSGLRGWTF